MKTVNWAKMGILLLGMIVLAGCGEDTETITYGNMEIQYSDDSVTIEYKTDEDREEWVEPPAEEVAEEKPEEAEYSPEQIIDLFADAEEWFRYSGASGKGSVELEIPEGYTRECNGYYFVENGIVTDGLDLIYDNESIGFIRYKLDDNKELSSGDTFTLKALYGALKVENVGKDIPMNSIFSQTGHMVINETMDYQFPDRGQYITDKNGFKTEYHDAIYAYLDDLIYNKNLNYSNLAKGSFEIGEIYFGTVKPGAVMEFDSKAIITAFVYRTGEYGQEDIYCIHLYDLIETPEGDFAIEGCKVKSIWGKDIQEYLLKSYEYELIG